MLLIVGLGNPGTRYRDTRHNAGFQCVDTLAHRWDIPVKERRPKTVLGVGRYGGHEVVLAKPRTFMNNSGEAIAYLLARFGGGPQSLVVIYDDMELAVGRLRIRPSGSDGGHNGMKAIISTLHTIQFARIRLGIGPPPEGQSSVRYVLGRFSPEEADLIAPAVDRVAEAVECLLEENIDVAMNRFN